MSICVAYYNHDVYLESLIDAFKGQSYPNFEVCIVNDGSGERARGEFERVAQLTRDTRFRFTATENRGPGKARNTAASMSTGEYLLFFDADNLPKGSDFVSSLVRAIEGCGADCVSMPYDVVGAECLRPTHGDILCSFRPIGGCVEAGFVENVLGDSTVIIRRRVFEAVGGFPLGRESWEDHEFLLRVSAAGYRLETFPHALFYYRQSAQGRYQSANRYRNFRSLMSELSKAPPQVLSRIVSEVALPLALPRK